MCSWLHNVETYMYLSNNLITAVATLFVLATLLPLTTTVTSAFAQGQEKETICHSPPGNPDNGHEINVGKPAAEHHLAQYDDTADHDKKCP